MAACGAAVEEKKVDEVVDEKKGDEDLKKVVTIKWGRTRMWGRLCYTSSRGLRNLFKKVNALSWVSKTIPDTPASGSGWGKHESNYHLKEEDKDYGIELSIDGVVIHEWTWRDQSEASGKELSKERWEDGFLANVYNKFPALKNA